MTPQFEQRGWLDDRTPDKKLKSSASSKRACQNSYPEALVRDSPFGFRACSEVILGCIRAICILRDDGLSTMGDMDRMGILSK